MNKNISKSIEISRELFPPIYNQKKRYRTYHFSFAWKKNKLLSIGQTIPHQPSGKALKFAKMFKTPKTIKYPYLHSEVDMISKLWGKTRVDGNIKVVSLRVNRFGKLCNSKPCKSCSTILSALDISDIWWSNSDGKITEGNFVLDFA